MYISTLGVVILVAVGAYFLRSLRNEKKLSKKSKFSYKLDITVEPNWYKVYERICNPKSEIEFAKYIEEKVKKSDSDSDLWGRRYHFTEFYDSVSGLTSRFQTTFSNNGKRYYFATDNFGDFGYIFNSDQKVDFDNGSGRGKFGVEITESSIKNNALDQNIGGRSISKREDYLYTFPLDDVFSFLFTLGQRFHEAEGNSVIKWPDHIENKFRELGIKYETYFDYEPEQFDIEKEDKEFYEKIGKPKIALYGNDRGFLSSDLVDSYWVKLKVFRPDENDRIPRSL